METTNIQPTTQKRAGKIIGLVIIAVLIVLVAVYAFFFYFKNPASAEYQAVFLTNGQVYFGKLQHGGRWVTLKDVYYLQVTEPLQAAGTDANAQPNTTGTANTNKEIKLVKLGSELHGPEDVMYIDPKNILFWENMKEDSKVVESIKKSPAR